MLDALQGSKLDTNPSLEVPRRREISTILGTALVLAARLGRSVSSSSISGRPMAHLHMVPLALHGARVCPSASVEHCTR